MPLFQLTHLRPWKKGDEAQLAAIANHFEIWENLTDVFPHPYTLHDAEDWVQLNLKAEPTQNFAIIVNGKVAGGAGFSFKAGNFRQTAEVGYWLGLDYWGKGIASHALKECTEYVFSQYPEIHRLEAIVREPNLASARVLEKCGYELEGIMRKKFVKNGERFNLKLYSKLRD